MEYEFTELEQIVSGIINPKNQSFEKLTESHIHQFAMTCFNEVERIIKKIRVSVLQSVDENCIKVYIHQHQESLIGFADDIYVYLKSGKLQSPKNKAQAQHVVTFCDEVYQCINRLLLYLEKQYRQYFDLDAKLALLCHEEFAKTIKGSLNQIKKELKRNAVNEDLIKITSDPFDSLQNGSARISYRERNYLQALLFEILNQINQKERTMTTDELCDLLLGLNYNNTRFLSFIIQHYGSVTRDFRNNNELMIFYFLKKKMLNQLAIKPLMVYKMELPNIREQIGNWFTEEIQFIERKQELYELNEYENNEYPEEKFKIHTKLGVGQLACLLKLLIDSGIIVNCNDKEITKMVAQNFKTDRIENISELSLRNKYYSIDKITADKVKDFILNILNLIRTY